MNMKYKKHKKYTTEEKIQIVLLYIDRHMSITEIVRMYDISDRNVLYRWAKQYQETGTIVEKHGRGTKVAFFNKRHFRKYLEKSYDEMTKQELIAKLELYEDIKKSLACLGKQRKKNTK